MAFRVASRHRFLLDPSLPSCDAGDLFLTPPSAFCVSLVSFLGPLRLAALVRGSVPPHRRCSNALGSGRRLARVELSIRCSAGPDCRTYAACLSASHSPRFRRVRSRRWPLALGLSGAADGASRVLSTSRGLLVPPRTPVSSVSRLASQLPSRRHSRWTRAPAECHSSDQRDRSSTTARLTSSAADRDRGTPSPSGTSAHHTRCPARTRPAARGARLPGRPDTRRCRSWSEPCTRRRSASGGPRAPACCRTPVPPPSASRAHRAPPRSAGTRQVLCTTSFVLPRSIWFFVSREDTQRFAR